MVSSNQARSVTAAATRDAATTAAVIQALVALSTAQYAIHLQAHAAQINVNLRAAAPSAAEAQDYATPKKHVMARQYPVHQMKGFPTVKPAEVMELDSHVRLASVLLVSCNVLQHSTSPAATYALAMIQAAS